MLLVVAGNATLRGFEAAFTELTVAGGAGLKTLGTEAALAAGTCLLAPGTAVVVAVLAAIAAVTADLVSTRVAAAAVIVRDRTAAVLTVPATPVGELAVGTVGVVGLQDLPDEDKEIEETSLLQSLTDRSIPLALTQLLVLDMRMGDAGTGVASDSDHAVSGTFVQPLPVEHDPERSQIDPFQHDLIRDHGQCSCFQVTGDLGEFVVQGEQVPPDLLVRNEGWLMQGFAQALPAALQVVNKGPAVPFVVLRLLQQGFAPAASVCKVHPADDRFQLRVL